VVADPPVWFWEAFLGMIDTSTRIHEAATSLLSWKLSPKCWHQMNTILH